MASPVIRIKRWKFTFMRATEMLTFAFVILLTFLHFTRLGNKAGKPGLQFEKALQKLCWRHWIFSTRPGNIFSYISCDLSRNFMPKHELFLNLTRDIWPKKNIRLQHICGFCILLTFTITLEHQHLRSWSCRDPSLQERLLQKQLGKAYFGLNSVGRQLEWRCEHNLTFMCHAVP